MWTPLIPRENRGTPRAPAISHERNEGARQARAASPRAHASHATPREGIPLIQRLRYASSTSNATGSSIQSIGGAGCVFAAAFGSVASTGVEDAFKSSVDIVNISISASVRQPKANQPGGFVRTQALGGSSEFMRGMRR